MNRMMALCLGLAAGTPVSAQPPAATQSPPQAAPSPASSGTGLNQPLPGAVTHALPTSPTVAPVGAGGACGPAGCSAGGHADGRSCWNKFTDWLCFRPGPRVLPTCVPNVYRAPLRHYFPPYTGPVSDGGIGSGGHGHGHDGGGCDSGLPGHRPKLLGGPSAATPSDCGPVGAGGRVSGLIRPAGMSHRQAAGGCEGCGAGPRVLQAGGLGGSHAGSGEDCRTRGNTVAHRVAHLLTPHPGFGSAFHCDHCPYGCQTVFPGPNGYPGVSGCKYPPPAGPNLAGYRFAAPCGYLPGTGGVPTSQFTTATGPASNATPPPPDLRPEYQQPTTPQQPGGGAQPPATQPPAGTPPPAAPPAGTQPPAGQQPLGALVRPANRPFTVQ